jgi:MOSC domain-containing protein YiiM
MTTHAFDDVPKDPQIMRTLVRENTQFLGVYANVVEPGEISVGDSVELLG